MRPGRYVPKTVTVRDQANVHQGMLIFLRFSVLTAIPKIFHSSRLVCDYDKPSRLLLAVCAFWPYGEGDCAIKSKER